MSDLKEPNDIKAKKLIQAILPLTLERWPDQEKILKITDRFLDLDGLSEITKISIKITFITGLLNDVIKTLPLSVFVDEDARDNLISSTQELIDELVREEEDLLESLEEDEE